MMSMKKILMALTLFSSLYAEERIDLIANFPVNPSYLTDVLKEHGSSVKVQLTELSSYGEDLLKTETGIAKLLQKINFQRPVVPTQNDPSVRKIFFFDFVEKQRKKYDLRKFPKEKLVLFMWEPPCVRPEMYEEKVLSLFDKVYTWDDALIDGKKFFKFYYPVFKPMLTTLPSFQEKKFCTLINSDLDKKHPQELYSERKKTIAFFEMFHKEEFDFYGKGWNKTEHPCYHGTVENKLEVLKNYKFSICYENSEKIRGYVTEKIFDAFAAGNVPVYWGASNITEYVPKECFIDRRNFKSLEALYTFLKNMSEKEYETYLSSMRAFLKTEAAQKFSAQHFEKTFYEATL